MIAPVRRHEYPKLELPGAGPTPDSSGTCLPGADLQAKCRFHLRDQTERLLRERAPLSSWSK
jgi:hypothetical protein